MSLLMLLLPSPLVFSWQKLFEKVKANLRMRKERTITASNVYSNLCTPIASFENLNGTFCDWLALIITILFDNWIGPSFVCIHRIAHRTEVQSYVFSASQIKMFIFLCSQISINALFLLLSILIILSWNCKIN